MQVTVVGAWGLVVKLTRDLMTYIQGQLQDIHFELCLQEMMSVCAN